MNAIREETAKVQRLPRHGHIERAIEGLRELSRHEMEAFEGLWAELGERLAVARRAQGVFELVGDQVDLLPETRARLARHHERRLALLRNLVSDLAGAPAEI